MTAYDRLDLLFQQNNGIVKTARLISVPIRRSMRMIRPPTTHRQDSVCRAVTAISRRLATAQRSRGPSSRPEPAEARQPTSPTPCIRTPAGVCLPSAATMAMPLRIAACSSSLATAIRPSRTRTSAPAYLFVCSISLRRFSLTAWWKYCHYRTGSSTAARYLERPRWQTRSEANAKKKRIPV